jgi:hypothetical protein
MQKRSALANAAEVLVAKAFGNPASRQSEFTTPDVTQADEEPKVDPDDALNAVDVGAKIKEIMTRDNVTYDVAASRVHRAERTRKGIRL